MTKLRQIFSIISLTVCLNTFAQTSQTKLENTKKVTPFKQKDTTFWVINFRQFRDALYKNDKTKVKYFLNFPFQNTGDEIWYLAFSGNEKAIDTLGEKVKDFTEKDFDKYSDKIFTKQLTKCLLKIKTDDLYKNGKSESPEIKDGMTTYTLYVTFDKTDKILELNLATKTPYRISDTENETAESNIIYRFKILKNGHLKLKRILIAG